MKNYLIILGLALSFKSFAQSCAGLADGEIIRIDEANKALQNFSVQDQDGLGTCYANAASLLLQGSLEGNPEVSYLHLASLYKTEKLQGLRKNNSSEIYAIKNENQQKAINGGGDALKWDLAMDSGVTCATITTIQAMEKETNKPVLCSKTEMNLEKILGSADNEHKQFKTILETSIYMNEFQKTFGDLTQSPGFFNKKKVLEAQEKYKNFKEAFESLIAAKKQKIAEQDCKRVNADYLAPIVSGMTQAALGFRSCFPADAPSKDQYWCKVVKGLAHNPKVMEDGSVTVEGVNPDWLKKLQEKITQRRAPFSASQLEDDVVNTFIDGLGIDVRYRLYAEKFFRDRMLATTNTTKNLQELSDEYNEVSTKGFSEQCVKRNSYNFFMTKDFENSWMGDAQLCNYGNLMRQASNVILKYKESGLNDLDAVLNFLTAKAGDSYDNALMALYATDCNESGKVSIPKNLTCTSIEVNPGKRNEVDKKIIDHLKNNKPLTASLCASILKKPKSKFASGECGRHAVGITGIKCEAGKYKYLIQNSWGASNRAQNESIENIHGRGAYWFDETSFYDSVFGMDYTN